jgi:poly(3-hydroxybutyrate) depolymerase
MWQGAPGVTVDDKAFTTSILDSLEETYCIDKNRVFATGKSQGGGFVGVLACDATLSVRIKAFASVSGAFYQPAAADGTCDPATVDIVCSPGRTDVPILEFHGGADDTIAYAGGLRKGACLPSIRHWVRAWAKRDGLGTKNVSSPLTDEATIYKFGTGSSLGLVTHVYDGDKIGHSWPATISNEDNDADGHNDGPASFNASSMIIEFFGKR